MSDDELLLRDPSTGLMDHPFVLALKADVGDRDQLRCWMEKNFPAEVVGFYLDLEAERVEPWALEGRLHAFRVALEDHILQNKDQYTAWLTAFAAREGLRDFGVRAIRWLCGTLARSARENPDGALLFAWLEHLWLAHPEHRLAIHERNWAFHQELMATAGKAGLSYWATAALDGDAGFDLIVTESLGSFARLVDARYKPYLKMIVDLLVICGHREPLENDDLGNLASEARRILQRDFPTFVGLVDPDAHRVRNALAHAGVCPKYLDETVLLVNVHRGRERWRLVVSAEEAVLRLIQLRRLVGLGGGAEAAALGFVFWVAEPHVHLMFEPRLKISPAGATAPT